MSRKPDFRSWKLWSIAAVALVASFAVRLSRDCRGKRAQSAKGYGRSTTTNGD